MTLAPSGPAHSGMRSDHTTPRSWCPSRAKVHECTLDQDDRTHLDLWVDTEEEQLAEVERLITLGSSRVDWQYPDDADFVVLADPGGTLFCVIDLSK